MESRNLRWATVILIAFFGISMGIMGTQEVGAKETIKLKIGAGHATVAKWIGFLSTYYVPEVQKRVHEKTNYNLEISEHYGGSVAKLGEVLEATEMGILDIGADLIVFEPTKLYLHNWPFYIPFSAADPGAVARVTAKLFKQFPAFNDVMTRYNLKLLTAASCGDSYEMCTNFPLRKTEDMRGHKIAGAGANLPWISGVGAIPVQSNLNEAYTSLQTGVYEGWIMTVTGAYSYKMHEISKYFTYMGFGASCQLFVYMNLKNFNKLPKDVQKILMDTAEEFTVKETKYLSEEREKAAKLMKDAGTIFYEMPYEEKVRWANMMENLPEKYIKEAGAKGWPGAEIVKTAIKLNEAEGVKYPRQWVK
jgi:TRAP-type C4-dicarboxylate transport system substrate-binding protein